MLERIRTEFPDDIRIVFRHFPLIGTPERPFHDKAALSAQAAEAAGKQGKFWEMHDALFTQQAEWSSLPESEFRQWLETNLSALELDPAQFWQDLDDESNVEYIQDAWDWGLEIGMPGTPFVLINGKAWDFNVPLSEFNLSMVVKLTKLEERQFSSCPPMTIDPEKEYKHLCDAVGGTRSVGWRRPSHPGVRLRCRPHPPDAESTMHALHRLLPMRALILSFLLWSLLVSLLAA